LNETFVEVQTEPPEASAFQLFVKFTAANANFEESAGRHGPQQTTRQVAPKEICRGGITLI
jgi:hypothetical protein